MPDLLDMLRVQDPPPQELRPGFGIPRPGVDGVAEIDSMGRPFERSTLIRGPHQLASNDPLQAEAEIAARSRPGTALAEWTSPNVAAGQREDIWGGVLAEDKPAALQESLLAPFQMGLQAGMRALKPIVEKPPQSRNVGGSLLERNPLTGEWEVKFSGTPKLDEAKKSSVRILEKEIGSLMAGRNNPAIGTLADPKFAENTDASIAKKRAELSAVLSAIGASPVSRPMDGLMVPMQFGPNNPQQPQAAPGTMVPTMPGTNAVPRLPRILNIRRR